MILSQSEGCIPLYLLMPSQVVLEPSLGAPILKFFFEKTYKGNKIWKNPKSRYSVASEVHFQKKIKYYASSFVSMFGYRTSPRSSLGVLFGLHLWEVWVVNCHEKSSKPLGTSMQLCQTACPRVCDTHLIEIFCSIAFFKTTRGPTTKFTKSQLYFKTILFSK